MSEVIEPAPQPAPQPLGPPPPVAAGQQDLLGRRISAVLIDVGLLLGVLVGLGLTIGEAGAEGGSVSVTLGGAWAGMYLALALLYYFVLEAAIGQTVGKRLLGLRVVRPDGSRPSVAAIALRTLLRVVDWLPLLYLVGFVTIQVTGVRRQRLGDLAARTTVARALPVRRGLALAALALVAVLVGLSAYYAVASGRLTGASGGHGSASGNPTSTYLGHGVSFDYPAGWQESSQVQTRAAGSGDTLWGTAVAADKVNLVLVRAYRLPVSVTAENLDAVTASVQAVVQRLLEQPAGTAQAGPEKLSMGGLPGLRFRGTATVAGAPIESTLVFAFDHTTEYFLNCQSTQARAAEMQRGCEQIVRSFKVATPSGASTVPAPRLGNKIVFTSNRTGVYNVYLVNADGSGLRQLTRFRAGDLARPSLSPDGNAVVFERIEKENASSNLWIVRTDGRGLRNLTPDPEDDTSPAWSPDGTKIVFASSRSGAYDIFAMHPDGSAIEQLTDRGAFDVEPAISPDGTKIAFLECDTSSESNACQLWTMNADGTAARRLTRIPVESERPAWSPDSNRIAFTRKQHGNTDIYVISADSRRQQRLTSGPADDYQPTWSPDGTRIAFGSNRAGPPSLYLMQADGTRVQRLTTPSKGQDEDLSWQP